MDCNAQYNGTDLRMFRDSLRMMVRKINKQIREDSTCCGVGFLSCHVLLAFEDGKPCSLRDLQERMEMDKAALSRAVDGLVNLGMLTRKDNPSDRRLIIIEPTQAGLDKIAEVNDGADAKHRKLFDLIPPDMHATVVCAISHLAKAYDEMGSDCGCGEQRKN